MNYIIKFIDSKREITSNATFTFPDMSLVFHFIKNYTYIHISSFRRAFRYTDTKRKNMFPNMRENNSRTL